jgi:hypothetical protein
MIFVTKYVQFVRTRHLVSVNIGMYPCAQKLLKHTVCKKESKTMARKYLNDLGINDNFMKLDPKDSRWTRWNREIEEYGFPDYETWCLDIYFYCWLYERLKMFLEVNCIDLNVHKFNFENKEYTQKELIDKMLHGCELALSEAFENKKLTEDEEKSVCDIPWIWATVMPAMWW